jgi:hypothetical protein
MRSNVMGRLRVASLMTAMMRRWSGSGVRTAGVHKSRSMPFGTTGTSTGPRAARRTPSAATSLTADQSTGQVLHRKVWSNPV